MSTMLSVAVGSAIGAAAVFYAFQKKPVETKRIVNKISIVPRGGTGGVTIFTPNEEAMESGMYSKEYLENRICVAMGGRIAEEIINGKNKVTTGASNDFQQCTNTAKMMVE